MCNVQDTIVAGVISDRGQRFPEGPGVPRAADHHHSTQHICNATNHDRRTTDLDPKQSYLSQPRHNWPTLNTQNWPTLNTCDWSNQHSWPHRIMLYSALPTSE